jgi:hypothetical protein
LTGQAPRRRGEATGKPHENIDGRSSFFPAFRIGDSLNVPAELVARDAGVNSHTEVDKWNSRNTTS